VKAIKKVYG